ncbi:hypothetical protein [Paenibacillus planticolens]|uniref:Uncharacterized protein n=1 Tax=Paenibacillus planticolens TaxID=2654976 RepID=A0ABX1ZGV7_9BACL|nr:hypothetical protein [Paenibacillus planticolens]NOU99323.1 hypothetical protein [Paenibacillus planticolens]
MNITQIAYEESSLINIAEYEYGFYFEVTHSILQFLTKFFHSPKQEAHLFFRFTTQVQKCLYLAFLSALRRHDVQTGMMLRYSLESMALALYSMYEKNEDIYRKYNAAGTIESIKTTKMVMTWLKEQSPSFADSLKIRKDTISDTLAHGNFLPTVLNSTLVDGKFTFHFFDIEPKEVTKQRLWFIADTCFGFMNMAATLNQNFPCFLLTDVYTDTMYGYTQHINAMRDELLNNNYFSE